VPALGHRVALLDGRLAAEADGLPLNDQVLPDPHRLVAQPVAGVECRARRIPAGGAIGLGEERIEPAIKHGELIEEALEPLSGASEGLGPRLLELSLDLREPIGAPAEPGDIGEGEVVPRQVHAHAPLARR
jgi:hypothetical protein